MSLLKTAANAAAGLVLLGLATVGAAALSGVGHRWVDILAQFTAPALLAASGVTLACLVLRPASLWFDCIPPTSGWKTPTSPP